MNFNALRSRLNDDMFYHESVLENNRDSLPVRRSYIRAVFSYVEGMVNGLKYVALDISKGEDGIDIGEDEKRKLRNIKYLKKKDKEIHCYPGTKENLSLALNSIAVQHECNYEFNKGNKDWNNYLDSLKIRDAVTHPKNIQDLAVNDEKLEIVESTYTWFRNEISKLEVSIADARKQHYG